jgi:hypothetical protein
MDTNEILDRFITEEVERTVNRMNLSSPQVLGDVLQELFTFSTDTFLKNIGSQEAILDDKDALPVENWDWLMETLNQAFQENAKEWIEQLKAQKIKILCNKYFTKQDFIKLDEVEKSLKVNVKKYFSALQNFVDLDDFREKFFNLPFELLSNFCRFILNKSKQLNSKLKIDKKELRERIKQLKDDRKNIIQKISLVSHKYQSALDLRMIKELYDNGLFFEDNFLNRGVNEYITKLLNHKEAAQRIRDTYNTAFANDLQAEAENNPAYINHVESIKKEDGKEYFTFRGMQVGSRFDNEIETANNKEGAKAGLVIDKDSRFKEPSAKIKDTTLPWEKSSDEESEGEESEGGADTGGSGTSGGGGGGLSSGGGINYEPPELGPAETSDGEEVDLGGEGGEEGDEGEGEMPTDENGLPVDFGTPESNPEGVKGADEEKK